jgi:hypothetical protein
LCGLAILGVSMLKEMLLPQVVGISPRILMGRKYTQSDTFFVVDREKKSDYQGFFQGK